MMKPIKTQLSDLPKVLNSPIDLYFCSASFEARCLSISEHMDRGQVKKCVVARNEPYADVIDQNFLQLSKLFANNIEAVSISSNDPIFSIDNLAKVFSASDGSRQRRIVIDVTAVTHETVMMLLQVGKFAFHQDDTIEFVYAPAAEYSVGGKSDEKWLSKGIREIRTVLGYAGNFIPSRNSHLIVLAGFEDMRALALIQELEPAVVSVGYGDREEHHITKHQEVNEERARRLHSLVGGLRDFVFPCYSPEGTENALRKLVSNEQQYNTILAPMNTKLSTLGAVHFALSNDDTQLCYAQPEVYNYQSYSKPGDVCYWYSFENFPSSARKM